jgi:hypothetical protein
MTPEVAPGALAALCDGRPKLILLPGLAAPQALALPGLALWALRAGEGAPRLHPLGEAPDGPGLALPAAPGQVLGIVAPDPAAAAPLLDWWREAAPAALPPVIAAASGDAALPAVAARAIAALATSAAEGVAAQQGLVALRQASAHLQPPAMPVLVASAEPSPGGHAVAAKAGRLALGQALGTKLEGLAAIALHLREALLGAEAVLRVRLYGAESGRIIGA